MQIEKYHFDLLKNKIDAIRPGFLDKENTLQSFDLRLNALDDACNQMKLHSRQSFLQFQDGLARLAQLHNQSCQIIAEGNYQNHIITMVESFRSSRLQQHEILQNKITQQIQKTCLKMLQEGQNIIEKQELFQQNSKKIMHEIVTQLKQLQSLRTADDTHIMETLGALLSQCQEQLDGGFKNDIDFKDMLTDLLMSVQLEVRGLKEERQPVEKNLYDMLSSLCDKIHQCQ